MHRSYTQYDVKISHVVPLKVKMLEIDKKAALTLTAIYLNDSKPMSSGTILAIKHNMKEIRDIVQACVLE